MDQLEELIRRKIEARNNLRQTASALEDQLADVTRQLDGLNSVLREADIELRALQQAASLRPRRDDVPAETSARRGGRQKGAISKRWRQALADVVALGNSPVEWQQFYLATRGRLGLAESSVKERVRQYISGGLLEEIDGKYRVSQAAIEKLDLLKGADAMAGDDAEDDDADESYPRSADHAHNEKAPH